MYYLHINKLKKEALYIQLSNSIKEAIHKGILKQHDQLPTEEEIRERFQISNVAIKQAYSKLIEEQYIERIRGKGSYVKYLKPLVLKVYQDFSVEELLITNNLSQHILLVDVVEATAKDIHYLQLEDTQALAKIVWVGTKDQTPMVLQEAYVPIEFSKEILLHESDNAFELWHNFIEQFDTTKIHKSYEFMLESIEGSNAKVLKVNNNSAAQVIVSVYKEEERPIAYFKSIFPGEYFIIDFSYGVKS